MTNEPFDSDVAELAERLDAQRPRPGRRLRQRVRDVLASGLRQRALRRQSVWLMTSGVLILALAGALALNAPS